jgi:hypothetical protein
MTKIINVIANPPFGHLHTQFLEACLGVEQFLEYTPADGNIKEPFCENSVFVQPANFLYIQRDGNNPVIKKSDTAQQLYKVRMAFIGANIQFDKLSFFNGNFPFHVQLYTPMVISSWSRSPKKSTITVEQNHLTHEKTIIEIENLENLNPFMDSNIKIFDSVKNKIVISSRDKNIQDLCFKTAINDWNVPIMVGGGHVNINDTKIMHQSDYYNYCNEAGVTLGYMPKLEFVKTNKITPHFETKDEAVNFYTYLKSDFAVYCLMVFKDSQSVQGDVLRHIPMMPDYLEEWTEERIYQHMKLNQEEIAYIQGIVNRWRTNR